MDSKPHVPLSTTPATPAPASRGHPLDHALSSPSSTGSLPIRAPPTLDDSDIEPNGQNFENSSTTTSSDISDSRFESDGFVSGEEFETALERPFVADPYEETLEEDGDAEKYELSRPFVADPDEEISEIVFEEAENIAGVDKYGRVVERVLVGNPNPKLGIPIAQLSMDDDEAESEEEDNGFSGTVRVPGIGVLEKMHKAPKIKVLGDEEGEEDEAMVLKDSSVNQFEPPVERKVVEGPVSKKIDEAGSGVQEEESFVLHKSIKDSVSAELIEDEDTSVAEFVHIESLKVSKDVMEQNSILDADVKYSDEERRTLERVEKEIESDDRDSEEHNSEDLGHGYAVSVNSSGEKDAVSDAEETNEVREESGIMVCATDAVSYVVGEPVESKCVEADKDVEFTNEKDLVAGEGDAGVTQLQKQSAVICTGTNHTNKSVTNFPFSKERNHQELEIELPQVGNNANNVSEVPTCVGVGDSENVSLDQGSDTEKPDSRIEHQIDFGVERHYAIDSDLVESSDDAGRGNDIQTADCIKLLESNQIHEANYLGNGDSHSTTKDDGLEDVVPISKFSHEVEVEAKDEASQYPDNVEYEEKEGSLSDEDAKHPTFGSSETSKKIINEMEQRLAPFYLSSAGRFQDDSERIDGQIVTDSDEEADANEHGERKELFDYSALESLLKAAVSAESDGGSVTITSADGSGVFSLEHPAGIGSSFQSLRTASQLNGFTYSHQTVGGESEDNLSEEKKKNIEMIQLLRVKFLRLVWRLGHSPEDSMATQVLYQLVLAAGRHSSQEFSLESAKRMAMQLEAEGKDDIDFSLNILVLGKVGVGKSATINSIFGEKKALVDAFEPATDAVKEIVGTIDGVKIRVFDTPGLRSSVMEEAVNRKILASVKKFTKKFPPDVVLYVDRLDTHSRDLNDLPLLRSITGLLGSSIWQNAVITLTHAASATPDGPSGSPVNFEVFVSQRSHVIQRSISQAIGDLHLMNPSMMHPVSLVENHPSCGNNQYGESWKPQLLLLCYSMKILSEASSMPKPQQPLDNQKLFRFRVRTLPLPYLLSSLLQSRSHPKLSADQGGEDVDSDIELADWSNSDQEDEDEYDQLPPFKPLRRSQVAKLRKEQRKAYFEEYDYRVKLLQKKQWREEVKRLKEMKKKGKDNGNDHGFVGEDGSPATVPVPLPDNVLPPSFGGDYPAYRYRFLEPTSQLLVRPVHEWQGWDHDCGYDGVSLERNLAIAGQFPAGFSVQITKDKKEFNIHLDSSVSTKHGEKGSTMAGFDIQAIGNQLAYILRGETKIKNFKINKTAAGVSITFLGENVASGLKLEDQIAIGTHLVLVGSTGAIRSQGDTACGANLEVRLKDKDVPIGHDQSTLGLSLMKWRGDLALMANLQYQFSIGRSIKMAVRVGLNNKQSGQITVRTSSSEQLQFALIGIIPIGVSIFRSIYTAFGAKNMAY